MVIEERRLFQGSLRKHEAMAGGAPAVPAKKNDTRHDTLINPNETGTFITPGGVVQGGDTRREGGDNSYGFKYLCMHGHRYRLRYKTRWCDAFPLGISYTYGND
jgi:hypothetical protein